MALTLNQEKFCAYYIETGNQSEAYRRAYPKSVNWEKGVVWSKASQLMNNGNVLERVKELQKKAESKSEITRDMILSELAKVGFSSIAHLHNSWIDRKEFESLTDDQKASIKSISTKIIKKNIGTNENPEIVDVEYVKIELHDKLKALETINKMLGYEAPKEVNLNQILLDIETGTDE